MNQSKLAVCQFESDIGNKKSNINQIEDIVSQLPDESQIAVFPELCVSGYTIDKIEDYAETIPGESTHKIEEIARENNIIIVAGMPEKSDGKLYNSIVIVGESGLKEVYRKQYPTGGELDKFTPSDNQTIIETEFGKIGFLICYDMSFPETMLEYAEEECDIVVVSSAWRKGWHDDWRVLARARALESTAYIIASNAKGYQNNRHNGGESIIVSPKGDILSNLKSYRTSATVEFDQELVDEARNVYNPVIKDREKINQYKNNN